QRDDPYLLVELRANQPGWLERIGAEGDVKKRKAMMFGAIEQGKVVDSYDPAHDITNQNSISWDDLVTSGNVDQASLEQLRRAAGFHDPRLSDKYRNTPQADRPAVLRQMFGSRVFGGRNAAALNAGALASPLIAKALFDTRKSDLPRFFKTWTDKQNKAFGKGLEQALDVAGTSDNQWRDMARAAIEKGVDPNRVFDPARMQVQPQNRQNLQKTILKEAAGKVSMYQLQSPQGALNLAGDGNLRVEDMARVLKALPKQIAQALRNDAKSLLQQPQVAGQPPPPGGGVGRLTRDQALAVMGNIGVQVANP
ncbi:MAG: hypothetical protein Q8P33_00255, partial [bacterium]|nr:hypothetical protein [bacterium]